MLAGVETGKECASRQVGQVCGSRGCLAFTKGLAIRGSTAVPPTWLQAPGDRPRAGGGGAGRQVGLVCVSRGAPCLPRVSLAKVLCPIWSGRQVGGTLAGASAVRPGKTSRASGHTFHLHHLQRVKSIYMQQGSVGHASRGHPSRPMKGQECVGGQVGLVCLSPIRPGSRQPCFHGQLGQAGRSANFS